MLSIVFVLPNRSLTISNETSSTVSDTKPGRTIDLQTFNEAYDNAYAASSSDPSSTVALSSTSCLEVFDGLSHMPSESDITEDVH